MRAYAGPGAALVDVVAEMQDQIRVLLGHPAVRREEPGLVVGAGREEHRQRRAGAHRGGGPRAPGLGDVPLRAEPVPVLPARLEPADLDVHAVRRRLDRGHRAACRELPEVAVAGHLPLHGDRRARHAAEAVRVERAGCETRPQHHTARRGFARGDAQRERVRGRVRGPRGELGGADVRGPGFLQLRLAAGLFTKHTRTLTGSRRRPRLLTAGSACPARPCSPRARASRPEGGTCCAPSCSGTTTGRSAGGRRT